MLFGSSVKTALIIAIIGVIPLPAATPRYFFAFVESVSNINFPRGLDTSKTSPSFKTVVAKTENIPLSTAFTAMRNSSLFGKEHMEYALRNSTPAMLFLMLIYCPAINLNSSFKSAGMSNSMETASEVSFLSSFIASV